MKKKCLLLRELFVFFYFIISILFFSCVRPGVDSEERSRDNSFVLTAILKMSDSIEKITSILEKMSDELEKNSLKIEELEKRIEQLERSTGAEVTNFEEMR